MPSTTAAQAFFNPESAFGEFAGWEIQTVNPTTQRQRAQALGKDGDEIASKTYDHRTTASATFVATADNAEIPKAGAIVGGYHIDTITVNFTNTDYVHMTVQGHKHGTAAHATCRTYTGSLTTIGTKFGCPATLEGLAIPAGAGVRSYTYTLTCNHVDELGRQGDFLAADNYDGSETAECELCETGDIAAAEGWDLVTDGHTRGNTQAETATATAERHIAHDEAA